MSQVGNKFMMNMKVLSLEEQAAGLNKVYQMLGQYNDLAVQKSMLEAQQNSLLLEIKQLVINVNNSIALQIQKNKDMEDNQTSLPLKQVNGLTDLPKENAHECN